MNSLPAPVLDEMDILAGSISTQIKASLLNIKNKSRRSGLAMDSSFKRQFLQFINDRMSDTFDQIEKKPSDIVHRSVKTSKKESRKSKSAVAADDGCANVVNEEQPVPNAEQANESTAESITNDSLDMTSGDLNTTETKDPTSASAIDEFLTVLKDSLPKQTWWKELHDMDQKTGKENNTETSAESNDDDQDEIKITSISDINFIEKNGIDYGFVPFGKCKSGFMRFRPKAVKEMAVNAQTLEIHVLSGEYSLQCEDGEIGIYTGVEVAIPKGAKYGLKSCSDHVGVIEFTYLGQ